MEEMKNETMEVEATEEKTWNDIQELADSEVTLPEEKSGSGFGLLLGGLATLALGGGVAWLLKKRAKKRKEESPSEVIDGEAKEVEEESDEDEETDEASDSDSMVEEESK